MADKPLIPSAAFHIDEIKKLRASKEERRKTYEAGLAEDQQDIDEHLEYLRDNLKAGDTTGDRITDHVLTHWGGDPEREEWYRAADARLKGHGGQLVLTFATQLVAEGPFIRHMEHPGAKHIMAPPRPAKKLVTHYQLAVLTGEELVLTDASPRLPTKQYIVWSVKEGNSSPPTVVNSLIPNEMLPLPAKPVSGARPPQFSHLLVDIDDVDEDVPVDNPLFVGDEEVGELFKKNGWPESFWIQCLNKLGRYDLVAPDHQTA
ncbi:MAG TPA: hypothetical protein VHD55_03535 [Candidatus Paceibacterota bacterium]|nr:hypothetical protein [Candidatus Paceibacterota bacterium]